MDTERPSPRYSDIDVWDPSDIAEAMIEGQFTAVAAVRAARVALVGAALAAEAGCASAAGWSMSAPEPRVDWRSRTAPS